MSYYVHWVLQSSSECTTVQHPLWVVGLTDQKRATSVFAMQQVCRSLKKINGEVTDFLTTRLFLQKHPAGWICHRSRIIMEVKQVENCNGACSWEALWVWQREGRALFHQPALLSNWRRETIITLLGSLGGGGVGGVPLRFARGLLLCLPFLAMSDTHHREEMDGVMDACLMDLSGCWFHCVHS